MTSSPTRAFADFFIIYIEGSFFTVNLPNIYIKLKIYIQEKTQSRKVFFQLEISGAARELTFSNVDLLFSNSVLAGREMQRG